MHSLYFAYGSNLCPIQMGNRCPGFLLMETAALSGWRWLINTRGVATIVAERDTQVGGVVYALNEEHIATLDEREGVALGRYAKHFLPVQTFSGKKVHCLVYIDPITERGEPRPGYLETIQRGAIHHGITIEDRSLIEP